VTVADTPLDQRPSAANPLLSTAVTLAELSRVRHAVEAVSRRTGLDGEPLDDWITAVNELMINVIRHGGGRGTVCLLVVDGRFTCEVTDSGPGFDPVQYVPRTERPTVSGIGGMGLWMVGQMADFLVIDSSPTGTVIRIAARDHDAPG
jgi:anti-sigma regulatory factor (Ser/Thr protein kinase)